MAEGKNHAKMMMFEGSWYNCCGSDLVMAKEKSKACFGKWTNDTSSLSSSIGEDSGSGGSCISSTDTVDDASSSGSFSVSVSSSSNGSLYDLSEIMSQLPIKRGLSKYYNGKSESFTSLARVTSIEDLAKKAHGAPYRKELKASKSCGNGLSSRYKPYSNKPSFYTSTKTTIPPR